MDASDTGKPEYYENVWGVGKQEPGAIRYDQNTWWTDTTYDLQAATFQRLLPHPPPILFDTTVVHMEGQTGWPTDYLGAYFLGSDCETGASLTPCRGRRIELYPIRIAACAHDLGVDEDSLTRIVLIHELQHALLHTGCSTKEHTGGAALGREWCAKVARDFLEWRLAVIRVLGGRKSPAHVLEQQAQLGTWHVVKSDERLKAVFLGLMQGQPDAYVLGEDLRQTHARALWTWMCIVREPDLLSHLGTYCDMRKYLLEGAQSFSRLMNRVAIALS